MKAFWIDYTYDADNADSGTGSRYGNYLRMNRRQFDDMWTDERTVEFAAIAWRIATGPVMAPPFVHEHPLIMSASLERSGWDGSLIASVVFASARPQALARPRRHDGREWAQWDFPYPGRSFLADPPLTITEEQAASRPYLVTTSQAVFPVPTGSLPRVPDPIRALTSLATATVESLVELLNREMNPLLEAVDR
jgi:hypothetical protein